MTTLRELLELRLSGQPLPPVDERDARRVYCPTCLDEGVVRVWHPKSADAARKLLDAGGSLDGLGVLYSAVAACTCNRGDGWHQRDVKGGGVRVRLPRYTRETFCRLDGQPSSADEKAKLAAWLATWRPANYERSFEAWNEAGYVNQDIDF